VSESGRGGGSGSGWSHEIVELDRRTLRVRWTFDGTPVPAETAWASCRDDSAFRRRLVEALAAAPFEAYFWELPPLDQSSRSRPFEFTLIDAGTSFGEAADENAFREHTKSSDAEVVCFENLSGDATLIVPCPRAPREGYLHLAAFVRLGPPAQIQALFERVARETLRRLSARPLWVSTAGLGVAWLHVRLDARPKYYRHAPYRVA